MVGLNHLSLSLGRFVSTVDANHVRMTLAPAPEDATEVRFKFFGEFAFDKHAGKGVAQVGSVR